MILGESNFGTGGRGLKFVDTARKKDPTSTHIGNSNRINKN